MPYGTHEVEERKARPLLDAVDIHLDRGDMHDFCGAEDEKSANENNKLMTEINVV
jgi:hypothetical protein